MGKKENENDIYSKSIIVFNDCDADWMKSKALESMITRIRHYKSSIILLAQTYNMIGKPIR